MQTPYYYMRNQGEGVVFTSGRTYHGQPRKFHAAVAARAVDDFHVFLKDYMEGTGHPKARIIDDTGSTSKDIYLDLDDEVEGDAGNISQDREFI